MNKLAQTLNEVAAEIPSNLDWVLRIDGHTDKRPIHTEQFASNWELSSARAVAIVKQLVVQGIQPQHLSANGFGQFQPLDPADTRRGVRQEPAHRDSVDESIGRRRAPCRRSPARLWCGLSTVARRISGEQKTAVRITQMALPACVR